MTVPFARARRAGAARTRARTAYAALAVLLASCALALIPSGSASAHPLGNFTVNRYDGLIATPGLLRIDHIEDLAEIPTTQAEPQVRREGITSWARERCERAARGSTLTVRGSRTAVVAVARDSRARLRAGQAGLHTLRVTCRLTAPLPAAYGEHGEHGGQGATSYSVDFHAAGFDDAPGWREVTARGDRTTLIARDVPGTSVSHELTRYPKNPLSAPADTVTAALRVRYGGPALAAEGRGDAPASPTSTLLPRAADRWTRALNDLVARRDLTFGFATLALVISVALGALHALAPGHGKTLMAAAAVARGRAAFRDVLPLAASVTVTHTAGVVALGLLIAAGSTSTTPIITWLGIASGALVTTAGAALVRRAWHTRTHHHTHTHARDPDPDPDPDPDHKLSHRHRHRHAHTHTHTHTRRHRPTAHTHTHPTAPTLRGTILLGFAGGLVPSPSAVVVLVGASALGQAWFGLLLVLGYGAGLALTLTAAGFAVVRLGGGAARLMRAHPRLSGGGRLTAFVSRVAPLSSAFVVVALGAGLMLRGSAAVLG